MARAPSATRVFYTLPEAQRRFSTGAIASILQAPDLGLEVQGDRHRVDICAIW